MNSMETNLHFLGEMMSGTEVLPSRLPPRSPDSAYSLIVAISPGSVYGSGFTGAMVLWLFALE